jgi:hypothetical protein
MTKHANEKLSEMGDRDVEKLLFRLIYPLWAEMAPYYCSSPNDIMPLAFEHRVDLWSHSEGDWVSRKLGWSHGYIRNKNPLRAICECLILKLESEL